MLLSSSNLPGYYTTFRNDNHKIVLESHDNHAQVWRVHTTNQLFEVVEQKDIPSSQDYHDATLFLISSEKILGLAYKCYY